MAGTQSVQADDLRLLGIPRSRQTVAIIYPQYGSTGSRGFPPTSGQVPPRRVAQHIHRTNVVRVRPRTSGSITDLLLALACENLVASAAPQRSFVTGLSGSDVERKVLPSQGLHPDRARIQTTADPTDASLRLLGGRDLTRYRNQPDKSLHQSGAAMHHHPEDQERALNLSIPAVS